MIVAVTAAAAAAAADDDDVDVDAVVPSRTSHGLGRRHLRPRARRTVRCHFWKTK
jgi:hypothetical protein